MDYVLVYSRPGYKDVVQLPTPREKNKTYKTNNWDFGEAYLDYAYAAMSLLQFFLNTFKT